MSAPKERLPNGTALGGGAAVEPSPPCGDGTDVGAARGDADGASVGAGATRALEERLRALRTVRHTGRIVRALGASVRASGLPVRIGERCEIRDRRSGRTTLAEVVGLERGSVVDMIIAPPWERPQERRGPSPREEEAARRLLL